MIFVWRNNDGLTRIVGALNHVDIKVIPRPNELFSLCVEQETVFNSLTASEAEELVNHILTALKNGGTVYEIKHPRYGLNTALPEKPKRGRPKTVR